MREQQRRMHGYVDWVFLAGMAAIMGVVVGFGVLIYVTDQDREEHKDKRHACEMSDCTSGRPVFIDDGRRCLCVVGEAVSR